MPYPCCAGRPTETRSGRRGSRRRSRSRSRSRNRSRSRGRGRGRAEAEQKQSRSRAEVLNCQLHPWHSRSASSLLNRGNGPPHEKILSFRPLLERSLESKDNDNDALRKGAPTWTVRHLGLQARVMGPCPQIKKLCFTFCVPALLASNCLGHTVDDSD